MSPDLIMPSLFSSVASRGRGISACVEAGVIIIAEVAAQCYLLEYDTEQALNSQ